MGADLYLHSVLQECAARYGRASQLAQQAAQLVQGDVQQALQEESQRLKAALTLHAQQEGAMSPSLFDLVAEITDLAQDESTVWRSGLADQIADLLCQTGEGAADGLGESELVRLARELTELLKGRPEAAISSGVSWIARRLATLAEHAPAAEATLVQTLAQLGQSMHAVLQGNSSGALAMLVAKQMIPALEQACADQAECLDALTQALEPLASAGSADTAGASPASPDADFAPAQVLMRWHHLVSCLHEATERVRENLRETLHVRVFQGLAVARHLSLAHARVQALWGEGEEFQADLEAAMGTLGDLLVRTLPPLPGAPTEENPDSADLPTQPISSPLRQVVGTLLRQRIICYNVVHFLTHCVQVVDQVLSGTREQALQTISEGMVALLRAAQEEGWEEDAAVPISQQGASSMAPSIPLAPGVTLLPGTLMDIHYLSMMASARQVQQHQEVEEWMQRALGNDQTTSAGGIVLSFWRLLLGEPLLWAALLTKLLGEQLTSASTPTPAEERARLLVEHLQHVLQGEPGPRLQALLSELQAAIAPDSPLGQPTARLVALLQGDTDLQTQEALEQLSQEVQDQTEQGGWPADRARDLGWLLDLAQTLLQASACEEAPVLLSSLVQLAATCQDVEPEQAHLAELLTRITHVADNDDARLSILRLVFTALPKLGPQPPRADPRRDPLWRFRLLQELLSRMPCLEEGTAEEQAEAQTFSGNEQGETALVEPVLGAITRMISAWLFPPEGYFRDPYNDSSTLWIATGVFWPAIANHIAEPVDEQRKEHSAWLLEAEDIPAQIPLTRARKLAALVAARDLHLPSHEQLARWGTHTIHVEAEGPYSLSAWHAYFAEQRLALLAFLEEAIARDEPILCSL